MVSNSIKMFWRKQAPIYLTIHEVRVKKYVPKHTLAAVLQKWTVLPLLSSHVKDPSSV